MFVLLAAALATTMHPILLNPASDWWETLIETNDQEHDVRRLALMACNRICYS